MTGTRRDGRAADDLRPVRITRGYTEFAPGSVLYECGRTRVLCTATVEEAVPEFLEGRGTGWVTAEYGMLPSSTPGRKRRASSRGRPDGREVEIQRILGRALRAVTDLPALGLRTIWIDVDVLQADGGTRTAGVTGAWIALADAVARLRADGKLAGDPLRGQVAAVSVGVVGGTPMLDLAYNEDAGAEVDLNVVMTEAGDFVEIQGTGEKRAFTPAELEAMLALARKGCMELLSLQRESR
ncbi:MAG: ribonuclease PH [Planctomycetes bacterium]|nr:ribonuclease PH [Planctomycetota bacterium]